ncbi:hypothetical protein LN042_17265 [Kitasatospora sp. RB6PN24]|uniref:hypothetical protein n=1 Tax=Kitasatospora humi TaxID=2893891 RepID=UPI001E4019D3|nr:hypothetical protein [Kitasatospora humi]MCC9308814.1 hypothetical protein [Kitasatospora humi]
MSAACAARAGTAPAAAPARTSPTASPAPASSGPAGQQQLDAAADSVSGLARSYQNAFTGLTVDVPKGRLSVYRKPGTDFDSALAHLALGVPVDLVDAPRSISDLAATRSQVEPLIGHTAGYSIVTVGSGSVVSFTQGVVEVGVTGDLNRAKQDLGVRFGNLVTVSATEQPVG